MLEVEIPGWGALRLAHLVLDVNGTLALEGRLLPGVAERIGALQPLLEVHLLTADTFGGLEAIATALGPVRAVRLEPGGEREQKGGYVRGLGAGGVVAIGNGTNDAEMLREAALAVAVLGREGLAGAALAAADLLVPSIEDALDLLLHPRRLVATLRR